MRSTGPVRNQRAFCANRLYHPGCFVTKRLAQRALLQMLALAGSAPDAHLQAALRQEGVESAHELAAAFLESGEFWPIPPATRTDEHMWATPRPIENNHALQHARRSRVGAIYMQRRKCVRCHLRMALLPGRDPQVKHSCSAFSSFSLRRRKLPLFLFMTSVKTKFAMTPQRRSSD